MNLRFLRVVCVCACLAATSGISAFSQGKGPGGGAPGGGAPGGGAPGGGTPGGTPPVGSAPSGRAPVGPPPTGLGPKGPAGSPFSASGSGQTKSATRSGLQFGPAGRWWDDKAVAQTIGLRREQQKKMDAIFNANKPAIVGSYKAFQSEQSKLEAIGKDPQADKARLFTAIDAVSEARASLQKSTTQMLLQIRQQMDSDQIEKLEKVQ